MICPEAINEKHLWDEIQVPAHYHHGDDGRCQLVAAAHMIYVCE